jgi:hypothetical protein
MDSLQAEDELAEVQPRYIDALIGKLTCQQQTLHDYLRQLQIGLPIYRSLAPTSSISLSSFCTPLVEAASA